ncbi:Sterol O-acyltransferase 2 [Liparis tanakae]|uniref:Sterol O-acyltransferase 2 n=1 Tax=Liparis tanakae TaxID=230148 RepID=A0A4Z2IW86_9TELE|nr:Sterol O-acyltransferase 2 [Liparis tanakae]
MTTAEPPNGLCHRKIPSRQPDEISGRVEDHNNVQEEDRSRWQKHAQKVKVKVLQQVQDQLSDLLDKALTESVQPFTQLQPAVNGKTSKTTPSW